MSRKIKRLNPIHIINFLLQEERRASTVLLATAAAALLISNSQWADTYFAVFNHQLRFGLVSLDVHHWINEGLMALFFLVVSLEVKREFIDGELKTWRKAAFPLVAAAGGMLLPAFIFSFFNPLLPRSNGWGIPMATDIAFAVGVLALLGRRVPKSLRIFLLSLAIIDDIGSIVVIGLFYQQPSNLFALLLAVIGTLALAIVRNRRFWPFAFLVGGVAIGYCLLWAGVSATLVGVIVAALMPLKRRGRRTVNLQTAEIIEDILIPITSFVIVPLFVFANAGLRFSGISLTADGGLTVFVGVALGLLIGKPAGIVAASWLAAHLGIAHKPPKISWSQIAGVGTIAGIGFTISLLMADLSYRSVALRSAAVLGVFCASVLAASLGLLALNSLLPRLASRRAR